MQVNSQSGFDYFLFGYTITTVCPAFYPVENKGKVGQTQNPNIHLQLVLRFLSAAFHCFYSLLKYLTLLQWAVAAYYK
jgi:hypothetical protein